MPSQHPTTNGRSATWHPKCPCRYRQPANIYQHPWLDHVLTKLQKNHLKINLDKCFFGSNQISYLGFTLTPEGIKPGNVKLKVIKNAQPPTDIKSMTSFVGLCNFFRNHIWDFAIVTAPLFKLTRQDSGYISWCLPNPALKAFTKLQRQLSSEPVLAFPRADREYAPITNATSATANLPSDLSAILVQTDTEGQVHIISHTSRQLKENEKNFSPFLLETAAAVWGMDNFNEYWKGSIFTLYADPKPFEPKGNLHNKTFNCLQMALLEHNFVTIKRQMSKRPAHLKKPQKELISPTETYDKTPHSRGNLSCKAITKSPKAQYQDSCWDIWSS